MASNGSEAPSAVEQLVSLVKGVAAGSATHAELNKLLHRAIVQERAAFQAEEFDPFDVEEYPDLGKTTADGIRRHRLAAGWTQGQLAEAGSALGLKWKRLTIVEIETERRRVSLPELLVLSAMFAVPLVELILPADDSQRIDLGLSADDFGSLTSSELRELITGHRDRGMGGIGWLPAIRLVGDRLEMPSADLHKWEDE